MMSIEWFLNLDIKYFLLTIILMGGSFAWYVLSKLRRQDDMNKEFWAEIKECTRLYNQVDKLTFGIAIAIQAKHPDIKLINESADGVGDHALNRSV